MRENTTFPLPSSSSQQGAGRGVHPPLPITSQTSSNGLSQPKAVGQSTTPRKVSTYLGTWLAKSPKRTPYPPFSSTNMSGHVIPSSPAQPLHNKRGPALPCPRNPDATSTPTHHQSLPSLSNIKSHATRTARRPRVVAGVTDDGSRRMAGGGGGQEPGSGIVAEGGGRGDGWGWERQRPSIGGGVRGADFPSCHPYLSCRRPPALSLHPSIHRWAPSHGFGVWSRGIVPSIPSQP